jgi:hypothetical protein
VSPRPPPLPLNTLPQIEIWVAIGIPAPRDAPLASAPRPYTPHNALLH